MTKLIIFSKERQVILYSELGSLVDLNKFTETIENFSVIKANKSGQRRLRTEINSQSLKLLKQLELNSKTEQENINAVADLIIKYTESPGESATYNAAKANDLNAVKKFLKHGGSIKKAFQGALIGKNMPILRYLMENEKLSPSSINSDGGWFIYWNDAWWEGLDYLLTKQVAIPELDHYFSSFSQKTPEVLSGLIKRGARFSPKFNASWISQIGIFSPDFDQELRIKIFQSLTRKSNYPTNHTFKYNNPLGEAFTPLIYAICHDDIELAKMLLELGADPNLGVEYMPGARGSVPLWFARLRSNQEMITLLIRYGAKVDNI